MCAKEKKEKATEKETVDRKPIHLASVDLGQFRLAIVGVSPLIENQFHPSDLEATGSKKGYKKNLFTKEEEMERKIHYTSDGRYGFPSDGFKWAAVNACRQTETFKMSQMKAAFTVIPDDPETQMVVIETKKPVIHSMVKYNKGVPVLKHFPMFKEWSCKILVQYNKSSISRDELLSLFQLAGMASGIGDTRPQKGGSFGMFEIRDIVELKKER